MEPIPPQVLVRQVEGLSADLREQSHFIVEQIRGLLNPTQWASFERVCLTGAGDSHHASYAAQMALESIGDVECDIVSAQHLLDYGKVFSRQESRERTLLIATSASGGTDVVVQAIEHARRQGVSTLALTGKPNSPVTHAADHAIVVELPRQERSPGIRTYQASLLGTMLIAIQLGEARIRCNPSEATALRRELVSLAEIIDATNDRISGPCREVADMIADVPGMLMLGSGPSYGTACFCAAKLVEASGKFAIGQDLEGWWHVERFACPDDMPVFVIAPPGRAHARAAALSAAARHLGRRVIAIAHEADTEVTRNACARLPVCGHTREEFSPLLYHLFAGYVASYVAEHLGVSLMQSNPMNFVRPADEPTSGTSAE